MTNEKLVSLIEGKKVLFISTKNRDYLRNVQEIRLLEEHAAALGFHTDYLNRRYKEYFGVSFWATRAEVVFRD